MCYIFENHWSTIYTLIKCNRKLCKINIVISILVGKERVSEEDFFSPSKMVQLRRTLGDVNSTLCISFLLERFIRDFEHQTRIYLPSFIKVCNVIYDQTTVLNFNNWNNGFHFEILVWEVVGNLCRVCRCLARSHSQHA